MVLIVGDLHGNFAALNELIAKHKPDVALQVGDFGYWPHRHSAWAPDDLELGRTKVYWCDGNHEDHEELAKAIESGQLEVAPNCFYQPRGSTLTLPDGRRVLFLGGAEPSSQELPMCFDYVKVPSGPVDIVISHTAPTCFKMQKIPPKGYAAMPWLAKFGEQTPKMLNAILKVVKPKQWFFGHYHVHQVGHGCGVNWTALGYADGIEKWWIELPEKDEP